MAGAFPPHECLERDHRARVGVDDGLVLQVQSAAARIGERVGERVLDVFAFHHVPLQRRVEDLDCRPAVALGAVHGRIGACEEMQWLLRAVERHRDSDRGADGDPELPDRDRLADGVDHAVGEIHGTVDPGDLFRDDHELVAAEPGDHVAGAHRRH